MKERTVGKKTNLRWLSVVIVLFSLVFPQWILFSASASGSTHYVSTSGSDSNAGTLASPWKTIQKAANTVTQGDIVYIRGGTYNEQVTISKDGNGAWITFQPYNTEKVIVDGTGVTSGTDGVIQFKAAHYIRITGLEIRNSDWAGVWVGTDSGSYTDNTYLQIDNCYIHNCQESGIKVYAASYIEFDHNRVEYVHLNPTSQEAISFSGIHNFNIHHNTLSNYGREGIDVKGSSQGGAIHHNSVYSSVTYTNNICIYIDPYSGTEFNVDIYNNYCTGNKGVGIAVGPEAGGTLHDVNIFNNIVDMTGIQGICIVNYGSSSGGTIYNIHIFNNIVRVKNSYAMYIEANSGEITGGVVIENNIFTTEGDDVIHSNNYALSSIFTLRNNICYDFSGTTNAWGNGYTIVDPKFVNRANSDFHLTSASTAAIDKLFSIQYTTYVGNIVSLMFDYDDNSRPYNSLCDIGAYEYHKITTDTTPPLLSNIQLHTSTVLDVEIGWENITCTATDDIAIQEVDLTLTNSNKVTTTLPMLHKSGTSIYYYNTSLKLSGNYTYHVWADDTGNNKVNSIDTKFSLPPNWDINNDGRCTILDKVCISLHYGQTGTPGWIREDVDNSGEINILDLTSDSNQYNNYWWK